MMTQTKGERALPRLTRKRKIIIAIFAVALVVGYFGLTWPISVQTLNLKMNSPQILESGFLHTFAEGGIGDISMTIQEFNYTTPDGTTKVSATSGTIEVTITPQGQQSRLDLNVQLTGVHITSPQFSGSFSTAKMTGYVLVDPATNQLVISIVAQTNVVSIIRGLLGV